MQPLKPFTIDLKGAVDRFIGNLGYVKAQPRKMTVEQFFSGESEPGEDQPYHNWTDDQWERLAITSGWVFSDIDLIAKEISQGIFEVLERDSKAKEKYSPVEAHPFEAIIEGTPNPYMSQEFAWNWIIKWLLLRGEAYWMLIEDKSGDLVRMYPLPSNRIRPMPDKPGSDKLFGGFEYWPKSLRAKPDILAPEQVCFHRFPNPWQYRRGLSPISAYRLALQSDEKAKQIGLDDLNNGLTLRALISTRADLSDTEFDRAEDMIRRGQRDGERYLITPAGEIDVKPLSISREDAEFLASRLFTRTEIDQIYGFTAGFWSEHADRNIRAGAIEILKTYTIWPLMCMLAGDVTIQVIWPRYGTEYKGQFQDIRPVDRDLKIKEESHEWSAMTWDQVQEARGRDPHPDSDIGNAPFESAGEVYKIKVQTGMGIPAVDGKAAKTKDLERWESVALRRYQRGQDPADYDFESEYLSGMEIKRIKSLLSHADSDKAIKAVFKQAPVFFPSGSLGGEDLPTEGELSDELQFLAESYSDGFNERVPEAATLLEAE